MAIGRKGEWETDRNDSEFLLCGFAPIMNMKKQTIKQGEEMELLSLLVENYEQEHFPIEAPNPIEAIKY